MLMKRREMTAIRHRISGQVPAPPQSGQAPAGIRHYWTPAPRQAQGKLCAGVTLCRSRPGAGSSLEPGPRRFSYERG
jgi:hypothetical protein